MALPVCTIDESGILKPDYADVLAYVEAEFRTIYGQDIYIEPDSQDGQMLAIWARGIDDCNSLMVEVYNSFSPSTARGVGLSSNVKLNGLRRRQASFSTVDLLITGQVGTTISEGIAQDTDGLQWMLPPSVVIPIDGDITVTATARLAGAQLALPNTITIIGTPTRGWQSVTNPGAAVAGVAIETDAELRRRQSVSTALPSLTVFEGTVGLVASLSGVTRYRGYENDTSVADSDGIPAHSISLVVEGGDAQQIGQAIADKKTPGTGTYGTTEVTVVDNYGVSRQIRFYRPTLAEIQVQISVIPLPGYTAAVELSIRQAVVSFLSSLQIGEDVEWGEIFVPANLALASGSKTFKISSVQIGRDGGALGVSDINIAFNEAASATLADVTVVV